MPSTFYGMEIGTRALDASQLAIDVTSQNVANVGTPGYSDQVVNLEETAPYTPPDSSPTRPSNLGTGVEVASVTRLTNSFLNQSVYTANGNLGAYNNINNILTQVQSAFNEPSTTGIGSEMTSFFNSFSNLATDPTSVADRTTVLDQAQSMIDEFNTVSTSLSQLSPQIQAQITSTVGTVNTLATQVASLNQQIEVNTAAGNQPNDLLDQRDNLVNQLSSLVNVQVINSNNPKTGQPNGSISIDIGGFALVQDGTVNTLPSQNTLPSDPPALLTSDGAQIPLSSGELYGLGKADALVANYQANLNSLASNLITAVNNQHEAGYGLDGVTGRPFFSGTDASDIALSSAVANNPNAIAAATPPPPGNSVATGNGDNATAISNLASAPIVNGSSLTDLYNAQIAQIGADAQSYQSKANNQQQVVTQLQNQQQSVSGVNLDDELTNLLQYERAYQAAARVINTMDNLTNTLITTIGEESSTAA